MRKLRIKQKLFTVLLFMCVSLLGVCQEMFEPNKKFGKPTKDEYSMTTYALDSSASAVSLVKKAYARYYYDSSNGFRIEYEHENRIKVLKPEGVDYANVEIFYSDNGNIRNSNESVIEISATSYNMENGKEVKTKMKREMIFRERINKNRMVVKFSIPAVKEGTIIEYKYRISSYRIFEFRDWYAQSAIPIMYSEYDILIPEYFNFNLEIKGHNKIQTVNERETASFPISHGGANVQTVDCRATRLKFFAYRMPAIKPDKFIWCVNDYISYVAFELSGLTFPGQLYKSYTKSWEEIDKMLFEDDDFGQRLKMKNPFSEEMATLGLDKLETIEEKVARIYTFLKTRIKWNESYTLFAYDIKKDIEKGSAGNASINFILMSMLREAGIKCEPVVMSSRNTGMLPITHPSYSALNTFVVAYIDEKGALNYIDSSILHGYINVLPPLLCVPKARIVSKDYQGEKWIDLSVWNNNNQRVSIDAVVNADGKINCKMMMSDKGQHAVDYRREFKNAKDSADFISKIEQQHDIKINALTQENVLKFSGEVRSNMEFEKEASVTDSLIYVNPMLIIDKSENPFVQEERKLPVELAHNEDVMIYVTVNTPEGYEIVEIPKPLVVKLEDGGGSCSYRCTATEKGIALQYKFNITKLTFAGTRYAQLRSFWEMVVEKNNEMIVYKKKK